MKDLLYLKDEQLKGFIEKIFVTYRESFSDPKKILKKYQLGTAHHKSLHLISFLNSKKSSLFKSFRTLFKLCLVTFNFFKSCEIVIPS